MTAFRAMGCDVVVSGARPPVFEAIRRLFRARDETFSRFIPDSELNRVNERAGAPMRLSADFSQMLQLALDAARETDGLVVPTLGAELEAAGYDTDFSLIARDGRLAPVLPSRAHVQLAGSIVRVPERVKLDLNGVVKGRTVDDAIAMLDGPGFVSAGGDVAGQGPFVASLPYGGEVRVLRGALATSGSDRRHWYRAGTRQHHLIDPRTGVPSQSPWEQVSVCASTCVGADIAAKAAFLLGESGPDWLDGRGLPGRFVVAGGEIVLNRLWHETLEAAVACI